MYWYILEIFSLRPNEFKQYYDKHYQEIYTQ